MSSTPRRRAACALAAVLLPCLASANGARSFKTGPIQISADGAWVWVANADNDSISRIETATDAVTEYPLPMDRPGPGSSNRHQPRGLAVTENGAEVWVACHDSDRLYVIDGLDAGPDPAGTILARIDLPWGSGPYGVALSRPSGFGSQQRWALITCHRAEAIDLYDVTSRTLVRRLAPTFRSPLGAAWLDDGTTAWVTHLFADGEDPRMSRVDVGGSEPKLKSEIFAKSTQPKQSLSLTDANPAHNVAEGGYLTFRGHPAQRPSGAGGGRVWCPTQYNNINENRFTPESTIQSTIRQLDVATRLIPNTNADKVILTAVQVHDPTTGGSNPPWVGSGWDAHVSGPVDIGFSSDGATGYVLFEQSDDLVVMPSNTPAVRPAGLPLPEIDVGARPLGMALAPASDLAYVWNSLDFDVSVVDLAARAELRRIPVTPTTIVPFPPLETPQKLLGARLFHQSVDSRICGNQKVSCASCHPHGEHDGRTWDFQALPGNHGPRSTMSLLGLALTFGPADSVTGFGQLHRSGDRDEVQDFEHTFQGVNMGGTGFLGGSVNPELGPAINAGLDPDLDALAEYVLALPPLMRSPHREAFGALSEAAVRGATFFSGSNPGKPADAACATCHDPARGFVDQAFHDVGQRQPGSERELNQASRAPHQWEVNTPTLIGCWTTPPYDGVSSYAENMLDVLVNLARRTTHGRPGGLTRRQLRDLEEFVLSIDGSTTASDVSAARDATPPRLERVSPTSLTRIEAWFSESVDPATAGDVLNWSVVEVGRGPVTIVSASAASAAGDRVTLTVDALRRGCAPVTYEVRPGGGILDLAGTATGGVSNALDSADPSNVHRFDVADTMTITLGTSGYENVDVRVHDCASIPGFNGGSHGSIWLPGIGSPAQKPVGWIRFDWAAAFTAATGIATGSSITDASVTLEGEWGDSLTLEARRCLLPWSDDGHTDWSYANPAGAPSWASNVNGTSSWNQAGCLKRTAGVEGLSVSDYGAGDDTAFTPDAVVTMPATNEPLVLGGAAVAAAFGFWLDHPALDHGYAIHLAPGAAHEAKFHRSENELGLKAPFVTITYALPAGTSLAPPEVSGQLSPQQLLVAKDPGGLRVSFEDLGASVLTYSLYSGHVGGRAGDPADWYSHAGLACGATPPTSPRGRDLVVATPPATAYFLVTGEDGCDEGPTGTDSFGVVQDPSRRDCSP